MAVVATNDRKLQGICCIFRLRYLAQSVVIGVQGQPRYVVIGGRHYDYPG